MKLVWFLVIFACCNAKNFEFNRTQLINQFLNKTGQQEENKTHWVLSQINTLQGENQNRSQIRLELLNKTLPERNSSRWNNTSFYKPNKWNSATFNDTKWNHRPRRYLVPNSDTWNHTTQNGDLIIGQVLYLDRLLFNATFRKEKRWWAGREKIFAYPYDLPGKYNSNRKETITSIRIYNHFLDGLDSKAEILAGGVGFRFVKIKLSSPWNKGFEYLVQIFGK